MKRKMKKRKEIINYNTHTNRERILQKTYFKCRKTKILFEVKKYVSLYHLIQIRLVGIEPTLPVIKTRSTCYSLVVHRNTSISI